MTYFHAKQSLILSWLNAKGYSGTIGDAFRTYVQSGSSFNPGTVYDHLVDRLYSAGYSGGLQDMLTTMFQSKTSISNRKDAERAFFSDSSLDFFSSGGENLITDTDGNQITDTNNNNITDTN